ncbi:MAG TPA: UV DNA damage repair endonuclease UvsE [Candidatus Portnoybacteria bacterium]|jgi:UV DNA damage endonuclease|nr:UV DNA damage repair endonuclease UvsE [Candidatus Portnoybacteria bacterium]HOZ16281.1 UV DNA damage repair endonuclease UvsE [Candidatus Portnoybacteria bacterium]HPH51923.1 UV DNA damage repair endonuclease UvsE [Candidatus Portnoybacteria bacterium]HPM28249.1 UV DNA damage repair endonuclease UvsE [Candidatus Portnoybacteria bacterium]
MKIGYPCINLSVGCTANSTFRLKSYSVHNLIKKTNKNLECLQKILEFNVANKIFFFRIGSGLIPFASHEFCKFNWQKHFQKKFQKIGKYIKKHRIRISMHPDQFVLINAKNPKIVEKSFKELKYHCEILDLMKLDSSAKIQIHIGGVYDNKKESMQRFIEKYKNLSLNIKKRLVIENDDKLYGLKDCLKIYQKIKIPILLDVFHHQCFNNHELIIKAIFLAQKTWKKKDGILMVDYSSQKPGARKGAHIEHIDLNQYQEFINQTKNFDFDLMLEIKDKEKSALEILSLK